MPVVSTSRYAGLPVYSAPDSEFRANSTIAMRPQPTVVEDGSFQHIVTQPETLESLAWRYFGSSEFWWRIADANGRVFPLDIPSGASVTVPSSSAFGLIVRERSFG